MTLLRMTSIHSGVVEVDGIDLGRVPDDLVRQFCFITVPQDNFIVLDESLRFNLDPNHEVDDELIVTALSMAKLWEHFRSIDESECLEVDTSCSDSFSKILDRKMTTMRELSGGQRQMFSICRAIVEAHWHDTRGAKPVVLLDEITSSLDHEEEALVQDILDEVFTSRGFTVILITHKIGALSGRLITGRDVVIRLRDGKIEETVTDMSELSLKLENELINFD